jgi:antitoxin MazE
LWLCFIYLSDQLRRIAMKLTKLNGHLAVLLPEELVQTLDLQEGDDVDITVVGKRVILDVGDKTAALRRLRRYRGKLPRDFQFDRIAAHEED